MKKLNLFVVLVIVVGGVAAGIYAVKAKKAAGVGSSTGSTFTVRQDDLIVTVTEGGSIRAHSSIQYKCEVERRGAEVTILNIVAGGTYITQEDVDNGMVLVQLDASQLEDQLAQTTTENSELLALVTRQKDEKKVLLSKILKFLHLKILIG